MQQPSFSFALKCHYCFLPRTFLSFWDSPASALPFRDFQQPDRCSHCLCLHTLSLWSVLWLIWSLNATRWLDTKHFGDIIQAFWQNVHSLILFSFFSRSLFGGLFLPRWSCGANTSGFWQLPQEWPLSRWPLLSYWVSLSSSVPSWQYSQHLWYCYNMMCDEQINSIFIWYLSFSLKQGALVVCLSG